MRKPGEGWNVVICEGSARQFPVWAWEIRMVSLFNKIRNKWRHKGGEGQWGG